jgi:hypothetical protein
MAVTATHLSTDGLNSAASSYNTASVSLSANKLVLVCVGSNCGTGTTPNEPTLSGASRTWTKVSTQLDSDIATRRLTIFRSLSSSSNSGTLTIDFNSQNQNRCEWSVSEFGGIILSGANGANAITNITNNTSNENAATYFSTTMAAFSNTKNATFGCIRTNGAVTFTAGDGFTILGQKNNTAGSICSEWKNTNDTTVDWTTSVSGLRVIMICLELKSTLINKIGGILYSSIKKIESVIVTSVKKVSGVSNV